MFLEEHLLRTSREAAAAVASLRLTRLRSDGPERRLIDQAIERMEGFGQSASLLRACWNEPCDVGLLVALLSRELVRGRADGRILLTLDLESVHLSTRRRRLLALLAHELITSAVERPLADGGRLDVGLVSRGGDLVLTVTSDRDGKRGTSRPSPPSLDVAEAGVLVASLVRRLGGSVQRGAPGGRTVARVALPIDGSVARREPNDG